jgi:hypothetical protein
VIAHGADGKRFWASIEGSCLRSEGAIFHAALLLRKVFTKLDITSRGQLGQMLERQPSSAL